MLARVLSRLGPHVEVISATSGARSASAGGGGAVDILITDLMMPEMNGVELIEALNDRPSLTPAATFLLTAYDSAVVRVSAERLHVKRSAHQTGPTRECGSGVAAHCKDPG
ncbi:MAG: response regulator [Ignavibacteriales bacterium]|nr:response regulator [Ignavibacteriales bacterium]